ncbi:polysaccharide biosynthesis/export family protein [Pseudoroseicyclus tamaricis]|uniref:Sugar transporter n=2 Tax=Pseudoroseicyclus tamaricis TaxID=2705421 RepID=A0A6B2JMH3_9RHOB|nr:polysaccharide biosynthesis/export family protein [Pseudoroseicyclus tamaricis]NDV02793.1 sugar transporter [Pseudoroseicyclus tamaricis]
MTPISMTLRATLLGCAFSMAGCGVTYFSPTVSDQTAGLAVREIPITPEAVLLANRQPYAPRSLPAYFSQVAGGGTPRGLGALPSSPQVPDLVPGSVGLRPPPSAADETYRIGVGDRVRLATRAREDVLDPLSGGVAGQNVQQDYTVRDDGSVTIPEVGTIELGGLTIEQAEAQLFDRFIQGGIDPSFSLEVSGFNSQYVNIGGAVANDTRVPVGLTQPTLGDAVTAAGGVQVANPEFGVIRVYRDGTLYEIPLEDYRDRPELRDIRLADGDSVFVDTGYDLDRALTFYQQEIQLTTLEANARQAALNELTTEVGLRRAALNEARANYQAQIELGAIEYDYVYLAGEVTNQGRQPLPLGQQATLADVLYGNGGFQTATGNPRQIYVLRASSDPRDFGAVTAWHLDAANAVNLTLATRFEMRPDDIVFIEEQPITRWNRALQQAFPVLLSSAADAI